MNIISATAGWLVFDVVDGEFARVIGWACVGSDCVSPVVVTLRGQSAVIPMPSEDHMLVWDPVQFERVG